MGMKFDLSAMDGLDVQLAEAGTKLERLVGSAQTKTKIKAGMRVITDDAKARINSITGNLAGGIETRVITSYAAPTEIEVGISYKRHKNARHAHLVEGGHGGPHGPAQPHPFWMPAVEAHGEEAVEKLEDTVNDLIDELWK